MSKSTTPENEETTVISFGARQANCHTVTVSDKEAALLALVKPRPYSSILLSFGGADDLDKAKWPEIKTLFRRALLEAAEKQNSIIIDGGTQSGVMQLLGEALQEEDKNLQLVGVAPAGTVSYPGKEGAGLAPLDPNHTDFVLVGGTAKWGDETATIFKLAAALAAPAAGKKRPRQIAAVLTGGGPVAGEEILKAVRSGIAVLVICNSGGFADKLATAWDKRKDPQPDKLLAEIIMFGELVFCDLGSRPELVRSHIERLLSADELLKKAWGLFARYDKNAGLQQDRHKAYQVSLIWIGIIAALVAIIYHLSFAETDRNKFTAQQWVLYSISVVLPVALTIITVAANYFKNGKKWIFFRAAAENFKREIYAYRTRTGAYRENGSALLAQRIADIEKKAIASDINSAYIEPYDDALGYPPKMYGEEARDDGFSRLSPQDYVRIRLNGQISYYQQKTGDLRKKLNWLHWCAYIVTGLGTLLAVFELQAWIALATTITTTIGAWLGQMQWESTLSTYNQNAANLNEIQLWWMGLNPSDQFLTINSDTLVLQTETTLKTEYDGWVQQMKQSLENLEKKDSNGSKPSGSPPAK